MRELQVAEKLRVAKAIAYPDWIFVDEASIVPSEMITSEIMMMITKPNAHLVMSGTPCRANQEAPPPGTGAILLPSQQQFSQKLHKSVLHARFHRSCSS